MNNVFESAIGGMADIPQWFLWLLEWDAAEGKFRKMPCQPNGYRMTEETGGASVPSNWMDYDSAVAALAALPVSATRRYTLGFWLTKECGYWFLDIDMRKCGLQNYQSTEFADSLVNTYPGAFLEWSSGLKGLHIIGQGDVVPHRNKPEREIAKRLAPLELEFYTQDRGIAFGIDGSAWGNADQVFNMLPLLEGYFPPRPEHEGGVRPEWRGPADDDVLIERALASRVSAEAAFSGKASFAQLWRGDAEKTSENDMALAAHLAFWTGCNEERIERLMMRSGMVRAKWGERRKETTYLGFTIENACAGTDNVYQEPERNTAVQDGMYAVPAPAGPMPMPGMGCDVEVLSADTPPQRISQEVWDRVSALLDDVGACGDELTLHNEVIPGIQTAGVPVALQQRVVNAVKDKLKFLGNSMQVGVLRALLFPPAAHKASTDGSSLPDWANAHCFVTNGDRFFNTTNGQYMSMVGFQSAYGRLMPVNPVTGRRENACEKCLHFWGMPIVEQVGYRPDRGPFYEWDGVSYANRYSPTSLPAVASAYTPEGLAGINAFQSMLYDMCGRRDDVFRNLLYWMAFNVQNPGVKIRWSPIIKGVHGDGKTLAAVVLRAAMGFRNVSTTSNSNISNGGGFTDWAVRGAVNIIEEIMLTGKVRHQLYNAMKEFITNDIVDINPKGATPYQAYNVTNHIALTNANDALPMEKTDRRWFVIFTPWSNLAAMMTYCGLDAAGWKARTDSIDYAKNHCAGELRAWFLGVEIPSGFDINGSALMTPEKLRMMASSSDNAETVALSIIANGGIGITENVISSSHMSRQLEIKAQVEKFEVPRGTSLNHMFTRLGYSKVEKQVKWQTQTYTIWLKDGVELTNDQIRLALDNSNPLQTPPQTSVTP